MEKKVNKNFIVKNSSECDISRDDIGDTDLNLINKFTRRKLSKDDVYSFNVVLCDNEIDRHFDRFTDQALDELCKLYVGKTGIMDHEITTQNQAARIFWCSVEIVPGKKNQIGKVYKRLVAKAYTPRSEKNREFILSIESGIKKEVSINCTVKSMTCSICGSDIKNSKCSHIKGKEYGGQENPKLCHAVLDKPMDAYEWSFVAVPAQRQAGVIKMYDLNKDGGNFKLDQIINMLKSGTPLNLSKEQALNFYEFIKGLEEKAQVGENCVKELRDEVVRLCSIAQPEININIMRSVTGKMSVEELKTFRESYRKKAFEVIPASLQLESSNTNKDKPTNSQFRI